MYYVYIKDISRFSATEIRVQFTLKKDIAIVSEEQVLILRTDLQQPTQQERQNALKDAIIEHVRGVLLLDNFSTFIGQQYQVTL